MAIRRAQVSDIPAIRQGFADVAHPPYYPEDGPIIAMIENPDNSIFVDTVERTLCMIAAMPERSDLSVVWLVPWGTPIAVLARVLKAAAEDALARFPERAQWRIWAVFPWEADKGQAKVKAWQQALQNGPTIQQLGPDDDWVIFWRLEPFVLRLREVAGG